MNLMKIEEGEIGGAVVKTVNARDLHAFLEIASRYNDWIANRIRQFKFEENQDFIALTKNLVSGGTETEHFLTLDMAKELSMVERNEKGKEARLYFIECERRAKAPPALDLRNPATLANVAMQLIEVNKELEARAASAEKIAADAQEDVKALNTIAKADGSLCLTDAAKSLQQRPKDLIDYLKSHSWIYRRVGGDHWVAYQNRIQSGDLEHKVTTVLRADGSEKVTEQVRVTPQGLTKLAKLFPPALKIA